MKTMLSTRHPDKDILSNANVFVETLLLAYKISSGRRYTRLGCEVGAGVLVR